MEIIDVDYTEVPDEPITETWYTCPSCGCLSRTGEICTCGYHPPKAEPPKVSVKKSKWLIVAVAALVVALACSVFYNVGQRNDLIQAQAQLNSMQCTINNYKDLVSFYAPRACVVSKGSDWYHKDPFCVYCNISNCWIYSVAQAVDLGYLRCPSCSAGGQ